MAFGGCYYGIVDVAQVGLTIEPGNAHALMRAGTHILTEFGQKVAVAHPELPRLDFISYVMFRDIGADGVARACAALKPGDVLIIGSEFKVEVKAETTVGDRPAIIPRVTGRAWIYG